MDSLFSMLDNKDYVLDILYQAYERFAPQPSLLCLYFVYCTDCSSWAWNGFYLLEPTDKPLVFVTDAGYFFFKGGDPDGDGSPTLEITSYKDKKSLDRVIDFLKDSIIRLTQPSDFSIPEICYLAMKVYKEDGVVKTENIDCVRYREQIRSKNRMQKSCQPPSIL